MNRAAGLTLFDSHCHLDAEILLPRLNQVLEAARRTGIRYLVVPGVAPAGWEVMARIQREYDGVYAAFGVHPMSAATLDDPVFDRLSLFAGLGVAIGEVGLDPFCGVGLDVQEQAFRRQIRLAVDLGLPLIVHCRRLYQRTWNILREEGAERVGGVMHAFSGSVEMAFEFIRLGFLISMAGTVTWPGAVRPAKLAARVPLDFLLLESESPDLAPGSRSGQPNEPAFMLKTLQKISEIRGTESELLAAATTANALRLFNSVSA